MAVKPVNRLSDSRVWKRFEAFGLRTVEGVGRFIIRNARQILAVLLLSLAMFSILTCLVIGSLGVNLVSGGSIQPEPLSADAATATFGAEMLYIQLTAAAPIP